MEEADRRRKDDFKKYEMEKELRRRQQLKSMDEKARADAIKQWEETKKAKSNHKQMKHPVSWEGGNIIKSQGKKRGGEQGEFDQC